VLHGSLRLASYHTADSYWGCCVLHTQSNISEDTVEKRKSKTKGISEEMNLSSASRRLLELRVQPFAKREWHVHFCLCNPPDQTSLRENYLNKAADLLKPHRGFGIPCVSRAVDGLEKKIGHTFRTRSSISLEHVIYSQIVNLHRGSKVLRLKFAESCFVVLGIMLVVLHVVAILVFTDSKISKLKTPKLTRPSC
jgi:hypothetical protein